MSQFWNERFAQDEYIYGEEPNAFFAAFLRDKTPGTLLLPCEGEGRNAVYAASLGWQVWAFDGSVEGRRKALELAKRRDVVIQYDILEVLDFDPQNFPLFDCIALVFAHFPPELRLRFHHQLKDALKPGACLIAEGFRKEQLGLASGGPKQLDMLYDVNMLKNDFVNWELQHLVAEDRILDEGLYHQGEAKLLQMIVVKPN